MNDVDDDHHKGWYCNITRPARIEVKHVYAEDMALDPVITADGEQIVVDEEEYAVPLLATLIRRQNFLCLTSLRKSAHFLR
ncbi:MAG: DUF402 domain-containing protein [Gammaproteobacteria bacterium]|nr:DUF402 domain-containing protein [Gammaproteobacteria bacterium]